MFFVYSTLSTSVAYTFHGEAINDMKPIEQTIRIEGGANVAKKNLETPRGVVTRITDAEAELLSTNPVFKRHQKNGFMVLERHQKDPEKVAAQSMESADTSAPLTESDFGDGENAPKAVVQKNQKKQTKKQS